MTRESYLLVRGWKRCGSFAGGGTCWIDPLTLKPGKPLPHHDMVNEDEAERRQLDRDATVRDYVNALRPPKGEG